MQVNPSPWRQIFWSALIVFVLMLLPAVANQVDDGNGVSNAADFGFWDVAVGTALAAVARFVVTLIPVSGSQKV